MSNRKKFLDWEMINETNHSEFVKEQENYKKEWKHVVSSLYVLQKSNESTAIPDLKDIYSLFLIMNEKDLGTYIRKLEFLTYYLYQNFIPEVVDSIFKGKFYNDKLIIKYIYKIFKQFIKFLSYDVKIPNKYTFTSFSLMIKMIDKNVDFYKENKLQYDYTDIINGFYQKYDPEKKHEFFENLKIGDNIDAVHKIDDLIIWTQAKVINLKEHTVYVRFSNSNKTESYDDEEIYKCLDELGKYSNDFDFEWRTNLKVGDKIDFKSSHFWDLGIIEEVSESKDENGDINNIEITVKEIPISDSYYSKSYKINPFSPLIRKPNTFSDRNIKQENDFTKVFGYFLKSDIVSPSMDLKQKNLIFICKLLNVIYKEGIINYLISNQDVNDIKIIYYFLSILKNSLNFVSSKFVLLINKLNIIDSFIKTVEYNLDNNLRELSTDFLNFFYESIDEINSKIVLCNPKNRELFFVKLTIKLFNSDILEKQTIGIKLLEEFRRSIKMDRMDYYNENNFHEFLINDSVFNKIWSSHDFILQKSVNILKYMFEYDLVSEENLNNLKNNLLTNDLEKRKIIFSNLIDIAYEFKIVHYNFFFNFLYNFKENIHEEFIEFLNKIQSLIYYDDSKKQFQSKFVEIYYKIIEKNLFDNNELKKKVIKNFMNFLDNLKNKEINQHILDNSISKIKSSTDHLIFLKLIKKLVNSSIQRVHYYNEEQGLQFPDELFDLILDGLISIQSEYNDISDLDKDKYYKKEELSYHDNIKKRLNLLTKFLKLNVKKNYKNLINEKLWDYLIISCRNSQENMIVSKWISEEIKKIIKENIFVIDELFQLLDTIIKKLKLTEYKILNSSYIPKIILKIFNKINILKNNISVKEIDFESFRTSKTDIYINLKELDQLSYFNEIFNLISYESLSSNNKIDELIIDVILKPPLLTKNEFKIDYTNEYHKIINKLINLWKEENTKTDYILNFLLLFIKNLSKYNSNLLNVESFYTFDRFYIQFGQYKMSDLKDLKCKDSNTLFELIIKITKEYKCLNPYFTQLQFYENDNSLEYFFNGHILRNLKIKRNQRFLTSNNSLPKTEEAEYLNEEKDDLKDEVKLFFKKIFENYSTDGKMTRKCCAKFIYDVTDYTVVTENDYRINSLFDKYDINKDDIIEYEDFLKFYKENFIEKSSTVWDNLKNLGFKKNFNKISIYDEFIIDKNFLFSFSLNLEFSILAENKLKNNSCCFKFLEILKIIPPIKSILVKIYNLDDEIKEILQTNNQFYKEYYYYILNLIINYQNKTKYTNLLKNIYNIKIDNNWVNNFIEKGFLNLMLNDLNQDLSLKSKKIFYFKNIIIDLLMNFIYSVDYVDIIFRESYEIGNYKNHFIEAKTKSEKEIGPSNNPNLTDDKSKKNNNLNLNNGIKKIKNLNSLLNENSKNLINNLKINEIYNKIKIDLDLIIKNKLDDKKNKTIILRFISILYILCKRNNKEAHDILINEEFKETLISGLTVDSCPHINNIFRNFIALIFKNIESPIAEHNTNLKEYLLKILINNILNNKEKKNFKLIELTCDFLENLTKNKQFTFEFDFEDLFKNLLDSLENINNSNDKSMNINSHLKFMKKIIEIKPNITQNIENIEYLPKKIFEDLIFPKDHNKKINNLFTLKYISQLIIELCKNNVKGTIKLLFSLNNISKDFPIINQFNFNCSSVKKSNLGYVGIVNLGCICYMNAMIQQFFNIKTFRKSILIADDKLDLDIKENNNIKYDDNLFHQFQRMFSYLEISNRKFFNPKLFCFSYKDYEGNPINLMVQQDAQEFLNMIFDKLEKGLKNSPLKHVLDGVFQGKTCSVLTCQNCKYERKNSQIFYNLSIEVKNLKSIEEGLKKLILEEVINDYNCDNCKQKANITKSNYVEEVPNFLIIHLQRIIYDLEIFALNKINSHYSFPKKLNLKEIMLSYIESVNKETIIDEDYEYVLKGVTCHKGNAEYGHYYSFINVNEINEEENWVTFDDANISKFDFSNLEEECFGQKNSQYDDYYFNDYNKKDNIMKNKSAYLLVYEKVKKSKIKFNFNNTEEKNIIINNLNNKREYINDTNDKEIEVDFHNFKLSLKDELVNEIELDNKKLFYEVNLYNDSFIKLISGLCQLDFEDLQFEYIYVKLVSKTMIPFFLNIGCIIYNNTELSNFRKNLINIIDKLKYNDFLEIYNMVEKENKNTIFNNLINNSDKESKNNLMKFYFFIVNKYDSFTNENTLNELIIYIFNLFNNLKDKNFKVIYILKLLKNIFKYNTQYIKKFKNGFNLLINYFMNNKVKKYENYTSNLEDTLNEILGILKILFMDYLEENDEIIEEYNDILYNYKFYKKLFCESKKFKIESIIKIIIPLIKYKLDESIIIINYLLYCLESNNNSYNFNEISIFLTLEYILKIKDEYQYNRVELILGYPHLKFTKSSIYSDKLNYGLSLEKSTKAEFFKYKNPIILTKDSCNLISYFNDAIYNEEELKRYLAILFIKLMYNDELIFEYFINLPPLKCNEAKFLDGLIDYSLKMKNIDEKFNNISVFSMINKIKLYYIPNYFKKHNIEEQENLLTPIQPINLYGKLIKSKAVMLENFSNSLKVIVYADKISSTNYQTDGVENTKIPIEYINTKDSHSIKSNLNNTNFGKFIGDEDVIINPLIETSNNDYLDEYNKEDSDVEEETKEISNNEIENDDFTFINSYSNIRFVYSNNDRKNLYIKIECIELSDNIVKPKNEIYQKIKKYCNNETFWCFRKLDLNKPFGTIKLKLIVMENYGSKINSLKNLEKNIVYVREVDLDLN